MIVKQNDPGQLNSLPVALSFARIALVLVLVLTWKLIASISRNENLRLRAVSRASMVRSAIFIIKKHVPPVNLIDNKHEVLIFQLTSIIFPFGDRKFLIYTFL